MFLSSSPNMKIIIDNHHAMACQPIYYGHIHKPLSYIEKP